MTKANTMDKIPRLLLALGLACVARQPSAQILPPLPLLDTQPPTATITSPAPGAAVAGTIIVSATASDDRGVAGVRFRLDGVDLGGEDTTEPYSISWDTSTAANGAHTLTAVARDAAGNQGASAPVDVTVANAPPEAAVRRYEETDASVRFSPGWVADGSWFAWSGGSAVESMAAGTQATVTFQGTSVTWLGMRGPDSGIARVSLDGIFVAEVDMFARSYEVHVPVFSASGLGNAQHALTIEVTGLKNPDPLAQGSPLALVVVDAFDVPAPVVSHLQDTDPDMTYTAGWSAGDQSRSWSGWYAHASGTAGAQATLTFSGTGVSWIGYRGPDAGIARVYLDGSLAAQVDLYHPDPRIQAIAFAADGLADGAHSITIEATGEKDPGASDSRVVVDALDVTAPGARYEETDPAVAYAGSWQHGNLNRAWSMGTASASDVAGSRASFSFTGTAVRWIGCRKGTTGIARVYLDGAFVAEIDTYSPGEGFQNTIYEAIGLAPGSHTLEVEATGLKNPAASSGYVVVDAFDVRP
jgi:hypothetical protein